MDALLVNLAQASSAPVAPVGPLAPSWVVLPLALLALLVVAGHWILLGKAVMPAPRKALRTANGLVMMLAIPLLAFGFGVARPATQPRAFAIAWMLASALLFLVLLLAAADLFYTAHVARRERNELRRELRNVRQTPSSRNATPDAGDEHRA